MRYTFNNFKLHYLLVVKAPMKKQDKQRLFKPRCLIVFAGALALITVLLSVLHLHDLAVDDIGEPYFSPVVAPVTHGQAQDDAIVAATAATSEPAQYVAGRVPPEITSNDVSDVDYSAEDALAEMIEVPDVYREQQKEPVASRPRQHVEYTGPPRRLSGGGCSFKLCPSSWDSPDAPNVPWTPDLQNVAGKMSATLPRLFVIVPFRNRLDNLVRLLSGINNSTSPQQRGCTCIVIADFNTQVAVTPNWKNLSCIATWHEQHALYVGEDDVIDDGSARMDLDDIIEAMQPHACPVSKYGIPRRFMNSPDSTVVHMRR